MRVPTGSWRLFAPIAAIAATSGPARTSSVSVDPEPPLSTSAAVPVVAPLPSAVVASAGAATTSSAAPAPSATAPSAGGPVLDLDGAAWSPDKKLVATIIELHVHLWNGETRQHLRQLEDDRNSTSVVFSPDGKRLYVGQENNPPMYFEHLDREAPTLGSLQLPKTIHPETDRGSAMLSVTADGAWLLGRCDTVQVCLWNTRTGAGREWRQTKDPVGELVSLEIEQDGKHIRAKNDAGVAYRITLPGLQLVAP